MINAGELTERLDFYRVVDAQSESGFKHTDEVLYKSIRAKRVKNRENYLVDANELFHVSELTFRLRYRKDIEDTDIVVYEGKRYRITSLDKYSEGNSMTIILSKINE